MKTIEIGDLFMLNPYWKSNQRYVVIKRHCDKCVTGRGVTDNGEVMTVYAPVEEITKIEQANA